jgi:sigma-B regulation protein RsbU (phosphoserine phosphatase)
VQLLDQSAAPAGMSLVDLNIRTAICAPLMVSGAADSFLYLDTRGKEQSLPPDAAAFCAALADLGGLSIERILATDLERRRRELERDIEAARTAQEMLMPGLSGRVGALTYAFHATPGRYVAGDFFDVVALGDGRVAFFLGDVSGKGVGAGVLMAAAQGALRALLMQGVGLVETLRVVNEHLYQRTDSGKFITLIAGVFDPGKHLLEIADAGHGLCCLRPPDQTPETVNTDASLPLGVDSGTTYAVCQFAVQPRTRLILFSDGAIEQPDANATQFGWPSALAALSRADTVQADVDALVSAVTAHAAGPLADDLTVASLQFDAANQ